MSSASTAPIGRPSTGTSTDSSAATTASERLHHLLGLAEPFEQLVDVGDGEHGALRRQAHGEAAAGVDVAPPPCGGIGCVQRVPAVFEQAVGGFPSPHVASAVPAATRSTT